MSHAVSHMEQNLKFGLGLGWLAVLKTADIKLQHAGFFMFSWAIF